MSKFSDYEPLTDNIEDRTFGEILKYINHPSITGIQCQFKNANTSYFTELEVTDI